MANIKLSKTQKSVMDHLYKTLSVIDKYETFEEFFDNSGVEQNTFTTAIRCNGAYNSSEKYKTKDPEKFEKMKTDFYRAKNERIMIVFAKTETIKVLEKYGLVQIIESAKYNGGAEIVKVL